MATAKYAVGAAGLKPADYANMAAVAASQTAMAAIIANSTALNAVVSSSAAMSAVAASPTAMTAVASSQARTARDSATASTALTSSPIAANTTALDAIYAQRKRMEPYQPQAWHGKSISCFNALATVMLSITSQVRMGPTSRPQAASQSGDSFKDTYASLKQYKVIATSRRVIYIDD